MTDTPERIWLLPDAGNDGETLWCDNPAPGAEMSEEDAVEYVRADMVPQWRPAGTAPKDGTPVDLWGINHLSYDKHSSRRVNVKFGPVRDWMGRERNDWQHGCGEDFEPTHWMPVPAAPKGGA